MKFKLFRQLEGMDCAPACIQMIAHSYGKFISLYSLRDFCNVTRIGVSGDDIVNGCKAIHLEAYPCLVDRNKIDKLFLPTILHWRQNHFIVLYDIKEKSDGRLFFIADPQYGKIILREDIFMDEWCAKEEKGYAILIQPTENFYNIVSQKPTLKEEIGTITYIFREAFPKYKKNLITVLVLSILISIVSWCMPFLFQKAIDFGITNKDLSVVILMMLGQLVCFLGYSIAGAINNIILTKMGFNISIDFLTKFLYKIIKLPLSFFDTRLNTDLIQRMEDQRRIQNLLTNQLQSISLALINFLVFSAILIYYNLNIFFIFILFTFFSILHTQIFLNKLKILNYSKFSLDAESKNLTYELIGGMPEIKINNAQEAKVSEWEKLQRKINHISLKTLFNSLYMSSGNVFIAQFAQLLILIFAAYAVIQNQFTIGVMMTITYIIGQLSNASTIIINFSREIIETKISIDRLEEINRRKDENSVLYKEQIITEGIRFKNVSFKYEGSHSPYVLNDINLFVPKGKILAIVGASGSGKTTLMKLMLSFYLPTKGNIFIDSFIMQDCNTDAWRQCCGVVMQDGYIYSGTVSENIALSQTDPDYEKVYEAAKLACVDEFIRTLPRGYNTRIGNNGVGLSGGQKQRILIARSLYKNPNFLFFDEATSSLDASNEKKIMDNLYNFCKNRTIIIIAHRLSTVRNADQIIFLDKGQIVELGSHKELIQHKGAYYNLIKDQLDLEK